MKINVSGTIKMCHGLYTTRERNALQKQVIYQVISGLFLSFVCKQSWHINLQLQKALAASASGPGSERKPGLSGHAVDPERPAAQPRRLSPPAWLHTHSAVQQAGLLSGYTDRRDSGPQQISNRDQSQTRYYRFPTGLQLSTCSTLNKQRKRPFVDELVEPRPTVHFHHDRDVFQQHSCSLQCLSFIFWRWLGRECK